MTTTSARSRASSCQILYSCRVLMLNTVIFNDHMQETAYRTISSPQKLHCSIQSQVLLKGQWTGPSSALICLLPNTIQGHQGQVLIPINQLAVVNHIVDHHSPKVLVRKIGGQPCSGHTHCQRLFDHTKKAIP